MRLEVGVTGRSLLLAVDRIPTLFELIRKGGNSECETGLLIVLPTMQFSRYNRRRPMEATSSISAAEHLGGCHGAEGFFHPRY